MCLAIPGKVIEIWHNGATRMAKVDTEGVVKDVCLDFVPDLEVGDYTIVHVGFALQRLDEATALDTLAIFQELGQIGMESNDEAARAAAQWD